MLQKPTFFLRNIKDNFNEILKWGNEARELGPLGGGPSKLKWDCLTWCSFKTRVGDFLVLAKFWCLVNFGMAIFWELERIWSNVGGKNYRFQSLWALIYVVVFERCSFWITLTYCREMIQFHLCIWFILGWQKTTPADLSTVDLFLSKILQFGSNSMEFSRWVFFGSGTCKDGQKGNEKTALTKLEDTVPDKKMVLEGTRWDWMDYSCKWSYI